jgi:hypothetical protein
MQAAESSFDKCLVALADQIKIMYGSLGSFQVPSHVLCSRTIRVEPMHSVCLLSSILLKRMSLDSFDTYENAIVVLFLRIRGSKKFVLLCL